MACALISADEIKLKGLSLKVEERFIDENKGFGLFATEDIEEGETILIEDPLVSCQFPYNKEYGYDACSHCLRPFESTEENVRRLAQWPDIALPHLDCSYKGIKPIFCTQCKTEKYCSEECRQVAFSRYHQLICSKADKSAPEGVLDSLLKIWKSVHYPPETLSIMLIVRLLSNIVTSDDPQAENKKLSKFCHSKFLVSSDVTNVLLSLENSELRENLRKEIATFFKGKPEIEEWLSPSGFTSLLALTTTNAQGIGTSPLPSWVEAVEEKVVPQDEKEVADEFIDELYERLEETVGTFLNTEGSGLYVTQSRINHNCRPNATVTFPFHCHTLKVEALQHIKAGQEIFISYLDECDLEEEMEAKQQLLKERYLFSCDC